MEKLNILIIGYAIGYLGGKAIKMIKLMINKIGKRYLKPKKK